MAEIILLEKGVMLISLTGENLQVKSPFLSRKAAQGVSYSVDGNRDYSSQPLATGQWHVCTDACIQNFLNQVVFAALTFCMFSLKTF